MHIRQIFTSHRMRVIGQTVLFPSLGSLTAPPCATPPSLGSLTAPLCAATSGLWNPRNTQQLEQSDLNLRLNGIKLPNRSNFFGVRVPKINILVKRCGLKADESGHC
jgi:hypothetical protein